MTRFTLVVRNVRRTPLRTALTILAMAAAILTFCFVQTILQAWREKADAAAVSRLMTRHKMSLKLDLPLRYGEKLADLDGAAGVTFGRWFGVRVPTQLNEPCRSYLGESRTWFGVYDDIDVPREQLERWYATPDGVVVGDRLAKKFGWSVGSRVALTSGKYAPREGGSWNLVVSAIYTAKNSQVDREALYAHYKLVNEGLDAANRNRAEWFTMRIAPGRDPATMTRRVDGLFAADVAPTLTQDERTFTAAFFGAADAILGGLSAVALLLLGIVLLVLANSVFMSVSERTPEYAVLKALGFPSSAVAGGVLLEAAAVGLAGGLLGTAAAAALINGVVGPGVEENLGIVFPHFRLAPAMMGVAVAASALLSVAAAALPVANVWRVRVSEALRRV